MNITTIKDIQGMTEGDPILGMQVTVKSAFPPKTGTNSFGDYSVQNATLEDATGIIKAAFFNCAHNIKNFVGSEITLASGKNSKGQFSGITVYDYSNKKTGAVERQIKANENTIINEVCGGTMESTVQVPATEDKQDDRGTQGKVAFCEDAYQKRESIERQVALREAVNFGGDTVGDVVIAAEAFYQFLRGNINQLTPTPEVPPPDGDGKVL